MKTIPHDDPDYCAKMLGQMTGIMRYLLECPTSDIAQQMAREALAQHDAHTQKILDDCMVPK